MTRLNHSFNNISIILRHLTERKKKRKIEREEKKNENETHTCFKHNLPGEAKAIGCLGAETPSHHHSLMGELMVMEDKGGNVNLYGGLYI